MFAAESYTSRHYIAIVAMACLCVLLGGPSYAAGAESLIIAGATYYEPGVSGPGWAWTDADHLELNGHAGEAIGAEGDLVLTLAGQNSVTESHAPDADITLCGMEVWGNLTLRGTGTLTATGSQCGIHVSQALVVDGCTVDARADGVDITDEAVAGVIAGDMAVRGGGRVVAACAESGAGVRAYGVYLQDDGIGDGAAGSRLSVDASWLDATGADGGVACTGGSLVSARFVAPAGGVFGASGVVDAGDALAPHVVVEPDVATPPAGETGGGEVPGGAGEPAGGAGPAGGQPGAGSATDPALKPATATPKTITTTQNDSKQDHGVHAIQGQGCRRRHRHAPQDRRQQLDRRLISAIPARSSAYSCRAPLLGIACIVMAVVPALSYAGNRLKASFNVSQSRGAPANAGAPLLLNGQF